MLDQPSQQSSLNYPNYAPEPAPKLLKRDTVRQGKGQVWRGGLLIPILILKSDRVIAFKRVALPQT